MLGALYQNLWSNHSLLKINYSDKVITLTNKVYTLGKKVFSYLSRQKYALSAVICASLFIELSTTTEMLSTKFINDVETCQDRFCLYSNSIDNPDFPLNFNTELYCNRKLRGYKPFSSLQNCILNLKNLYFWNLNTSWHKLCPSIETERSVKKVNKHMRRCFNKLCFQHNEFMTKNISNWCFLEDYKRSKRHLRAFTKSLKRTKTNKWRVEDIAQLALEGFFDLLNDYESMLASNLFTQRFAKLSPREINENKDLTLIEKGAKEIFSSAIKIIKSLIDNEPIKNLNPLLLKTLRDMEKRFLIE